MAEINLSPPEVPELSFMEIVLQYGLFLGAIFQIICILAIIVPTSKVQEPDVDHSEQKSTDSAKKQKPAPLTSKKMKKESKKKR
ncbi:protein MANBAL [Protopterus annectens]|uniref:protein MANBAL n=1 Tax=Protopterus annectens TaxID=7888 RepID=UPI001CFA8804|nr:protein MANBAL [Protopterus annectens]XP_043946149.1 protein MANBAL [Protopterus annectens]XP_043946150.1 protein MANBAL [Protopterus annectens]XP_043946151.1 protein MANBAL [Protopterus annectens]